jgi:FKBP-type peptidyl-prolyl cis-trans isomerase SlyD
MEGTAMPRVTANKVVSVTYVLRNQRGDIHELRDLPVDYVHGAAPAPGGYEILPKLAQALEGRRVGERIEVRLEPEDAFGQPDPHLAFTDDIENVPPELCRLGAEFQARNAQGQMLNFVVTRIADGELTVDANHPLAGQSVTFEVTVHRIRDAQPDANAARRRTDNGVPPKY